MPIAKDVFIIRFLKTDPRIVNSVFSFSTSKIGKSLLGSVEIEYLPAPDSIKSFSLLREIEISDPSGRSLQSSLSFFAGAVVEPSLSTFIGAQTVFTSDSRSVAVIEMLLLSTITVSYTHLRAHETV